MRKHRSKATSPRVVNLQPGGKTGRAKRWAYGYADLALLLCSTEGSMRTKVYNGWEPHLEAVCLAWMTHREKVAAHRDSILARLQDNPGQVEGKEP